MAASSVLSVLPMVWLWAAPPAEGWLEGVTVRATSAQVAGLFGPENLTKRTGLTETAPGSGKFQLTTNGYADGGNCWQSGYGPHGPDERPIVEFDLGGVVRLSRLHVWNHNGSPHRGFRRVLVLASTDGKRWQSVRERLELAIAPKRDDYLGEEIRFAHPVTARSLRFVCLSTHRGGGQPDLAGLGKVWFFGERLTDAPVAGPSADAVFAAATPVPADAGWIDVSRPPYSAPRDGQTDATAAIQRAINDWQGTRAVLFLPEGTYLVTKSLQWEHGRGHGYNNLFGAGRGKTILRLADGLWTDPTKPSAVVDFGFNGRPDGAGVHADWFNNNIADLTIDTGKNNSGAIGLRYYSNNVGSARRVEIRSADGQSAIGLDLGYADQNGPCLAKEIDITGFAVGVSTGATVNSQTLEAIRVRGATKTGFENRGQCLALRSLDIESAGPGFVSHFGVVALVDSTFRSLGAKPDHPAIRSGEALFARDLTIAGYTTAIDNERKDGTPDVAGERVDQFVSHPVVSRLGATGKSLRLPIRETPQPECPPVAEWANVLHFREVTDPDDSAAFTRAIATGASALYWPSGVGLRMGEPVRVPPSVRRLIGFFAGIEGGGKDRTGFIIDGDHPSPLVVEQMIGHVVIEHTGSRPLVVRDTQGVEGRVYGKAEVYLDNVVGEWEFGPGQAWCRQFNTEREGVHAINHGGQLWILGLKTERGGTLVDTRPGGKTEILGGLSYTTTKGGLAPMFVARDASLSVTMGEVCYTGDPFKTLIEQSHAGVSVTLKRGELPLRPAFLQGSVVPLYVGGP